MKSYFFRGFFLSLFLSLILIGCGKDDVGDMVLNESFQYLGINDTLHLTTIIKAPEDKNLHVIWRSTDENVVAVSANGVVKALSEGTARIVAEIGKESAYCEVQVVTYKLNGAYAFRNESDNTSRYYVYLMKNSGTHAENIEVLDGDVALQFDVLTSGDYPGNSFIGEYYPADYSDFHEFTFLKGQVDERQDIVGSFIEDKSVFNSVFLISNGMLNVTSSEGSQYLIEGSIEVDDFLGDSKQISFIYSGNLPIKNKPKEVL